MSTYDMIKDRNAVFLVDVPGGKWSKIDINEIGTKKAKDNDDTKNSMLQQTNRNFKRYTIKYGCM